MAESARLPVDKTAKALDSLIDHDLAEYDPHALVLRLTELPDAGEWPSNPGILESWFKRFQMVPRCDVRNAHVTTIRWMIERGALESAKNYGGRPSAKHEEVWLRTFALVEIPPVLKRGVRRFSDNNDTSTLVQPSLFRPSPILPSKASESDPVDKSDSNKIRGPETLSRGSGEGEGEGEGGSSSFPDPEQGGSGGGYGTSLPSAPVLRVHPQIGFDADDFINMLAAATGGRFTVALTSEARAPIRAAIESAAELSRRPNVLAVLREYIERGMPGFPRDHLSLEDRARNPGGISPAIVASPGWLTFAIQRAIAWKAEADEKIAALAAARAELGV